MTRKLIHIPIIHTSSDMGALSESFRRVKLQKLGRQGWQHNMAIVDKRWTEIEKAISELEVDYEKVRLYQDGLPVCAQILEIVTEQARDGSRNHRLLLQLKEKGAVIMGTEASGLIIEEYHLVRKILAAKDPQEASRLEAGQKALSQSLLKKRDHYIAERINSTLREGETGIIFLGMLHSLENLLDKDIQVSFPIH